MHYIAASVGPQSTKSHHGLNSINGSPDREFDLEFILILTHFLRLTWLIQVFKLLHKTECFGYNLSAWLPNRPGTRGHFHYFDERSKVDLDTKSLTRRYRSLRKNKMLAYIKGWWQDLNGFLGKNIIFLTNLSHEVVYWYMHNKVLLAVFFHTYMCI